MTLRLMIARLGSFRQSQCNLQCTSREEAHMMWHTNSALFAILATVVSVPACADILLKEIGSFHIGGHEAVLSGQPTKEVSFTAGMAPVKVDPNGEFEIDKCTCNTSSLPLPNSDIRS